jgi:diguanylate cyclase (GGDEF)-like protein
VAGAGIYQAQHGDIYSIFLPMLGADHGVVGIVCMEYDASALAASHRLMALYSATLSAAVIVILSALSYLSMSKTTDTIYKKLAFHDLLTGYENRMAFEQKLVECGRYAEEGKSVAIMVFDLNHLKKVNDTLGHKAGDMLIKSTADVLAQHLGDPDMLYRIGGDEFAAVIIGQSWLELKAILNAIRSEKQAVMDKHPFSCASGMSFYNKGEDQCVRDALARADHAMYEDKKRIKAAAEKKCESSG